jgi:glutamyl-tRNA reductase
VAAAHSVNQLLIVGVNHRTATWRLRERLFLEEADQPQFLIAIRKAGLARAVVFSTCERVEVLAAHGDPAAAAEILVRLMARWASVDSFEVREQSYRHYGVEALRHLFAMVCSLDSRVIGEPQLLGQVKACHGIASAIGMTGPEIEAPLQAAYAVAKRVRSETAVAERPISIAASALSVARNLHGDLRRSSGLLIGLGEMVELLAWQFRDAGLRDLIAVHPSLRRAESAAHPLLGHFRPWEELGEAIAQADVVVAGMGSGRYAVTEPEVAIVLKQRRRRPILFIDTAVPRDIDPRVDDLEAAFVYDLDDLERIARKGKANREEAAQIAWAIVADELASFLRRHAERAAVPTIVALRQHFEAVRKQVLADVKHDADAATRLLVNRLLHAPSEVLREVALGNLAEEDRLQQAIGRLFRIRAASPDGEATSEEQDTA